MSSFTKDFTVGGGPKVVIKPVDPPDANKLAGQAAAASLKTFANPPGPRDPARQAPLSKNQAKSSAPQYTTDYAGTIDG